VVSAAAVPAWEWALLGLAALLSAAVPVVRRVLRHRLAQKEAAYERDVYAKIDEELPALLDGEDGDE
jgi:hypothetical protein